MASTSSGIRSETLLRWGAGSSAAAAAEAAALPPTQAASLLLDLPAGRAQDILGLLPPASRTAIEDAIDPTQRTAWNLASTYPDGTVGSLLRPAIGRIPTKTTVPEAIGEVRRIAASIPLTYLYAVDEHGKLEGVVVLRDLFLAPPGAHLADILIRPAFSLRASATVGEAMRDTVTRHYPVYPVCDDTGVLIGIVRGHALFERQVFTLQTQSGAVLGVSADERLGTGFARSVRSRASWLLFNFIGAMATASVILSYRDEIQAAVLLAVFLPVVAAQGRNSGSQTMAVTLRSITSGMWRREASGRLLAKECLVGAANGAVVGTAGAALVYGQAVLDGHPESWAFAAAVFLAMVLGSALANATGFTIPLLLRRLRIDPAVASSILLSTAATAYCQMLFLSIAVALGVG